MKTSKLGSAIELKNSGGLSFFFVGTGSAFSKKNFQTNVLIVKGKDHLLVDCGSLCPYAFHTYRSSIKNIQNILITHAHADHIGGLEEMALLGRYVTKQKPNMVITDEFKKTLWDQSLKGGCSHGEFTNGKLMQFDDFFTQIPPELIARKPRPFYETNIGSINIKLYRTKHIPDQSGSWAKSFYSVGLLVDDRILFPGDTQFDRDLIDWMTSSYHIEYIFHDCQFYKGGVHASYDQLKTLPEEIKKRMYLCHYGDTYVQYTPKHDGFAGFARRGIYYNFDE